MTQALPPDDVPWPEEAAGGLSDIEAERYLVSAMMRDPGAFDQAVDAGCWRPGDCADARHDDAVLAIAAMLDDRRRPDPVTLRARMTEAVPDGFLEALLQLPANPAEAGAYAARVHDAAIRRRLDALGVQLRAGARRPGTSAADLIAAAETGLAEAAGQLGGADELEDPLALAENQQARAYNWVIPGMLDRGDRVIWVATEGGGKTTKGYQAGIALACGVHPFFTSVPIPRKRALIMDLEVDEGIRARNFAMFTDPATRAGVDRSLVRVWSRPAGLDLRSPDGQMALVQQVRRHRPDILIGGPMYKMGCTEAEKPGEFKIVSDFLDRLRIRFGLALWLEQHAPLAQNGRQREMRPIGTALWKYWPEFGFGLVADSKGENRFRISRFRRDRERSRQWPEVLYWNTPGSGWPWGADFADGTSPGQRAHMAQVAAAQREAEERRDARNDELARARAKREREEKDHDR